MTPFQTAREAKEFLISQIVEEAQRENVVLSEVERKMQYYSETGWALPDMEAAYEEFDNAYNERDYEKKISRLIRKAGKRVRKDSPSEYDVWFQAIHRLDREDHYLTVMIREEGLRPRGDLLRLWGTGVAVTIALMGLIFASLKFGIDLDKYVPSKGAVAIYIWLGACVAVVVYQVLRFSFGERIDDLEQRAAELLRTELQHPTCIGYER